MHRNSKEELRKHLVGFVDTRTTDYADSTMRVDSWRYTDPAYLAREHDKVFKTHPMVVAHSSQLPDPGCFLTVDLAGTPLLLVRQDDGEVRALVNICRHRGAQVETRPSGRRKMFNCPYHKWCYNRDGGIRNIPFDDGFVGMDRREYALAEYPADEYAGLVWVLPTAGAELDMTAHVGPEMDLDVQASGVSEAKVFRTRSFRLDMNWKVVMDGLTDAYHLQFVHPETVGPFFHTNIYKVDSYGKNWRMAVARRGIEKFRDENIDLDEFAKYAITNFTIYPGVVIATEPGHFEAWTVRPDPTDLTRCLVTLMFLVPTLPTSEKAVRFFEKNWDLLLRTVEQEDWVVARTISDGLAHTEPPDMILGRNEKATQLLHAQLARDVDGTD
ncbi:aromatic ring-hydroxylating oxygenase subunit alpha [Pseudonocardia spinosispora]|uniref:aromatic ring-hydroxylating oxygenase subunit alpha n=1 Tax=Pseudonocardia spinosispora TaxID=103441 RepID=UPI00041D34C2|nr:SRPBCC family protein [Pseudonocardia spinosispora]